MAVVDASRRGLQVYGIIIYPDVQPGAELHAAGVGINNDIYQNERGLSERDRVYLVAASIIATLGIPREVTALEKTDLRSSTEIGYRDGDIVYDKVVSFLRKKKIPQEKREMISRALQNTLTTENINKVENGESQLILIPN